MKASAWYQVTYHPNLIHCTRRIIEDGKETPARLSFAWIAVDYLARIKMRCREVNAMSKDRSLHFLRRYSGGREASCMSEATRPLCHFALPI
ncbi:unnamed protein product [Urochloa humidicola]